MEATSLRSRARPGDWPALAWLTRSLSIAGALAAAAVLAAVALVAIIHLGDTYHLDHVSGAWLSLARYVNVGHFYPALFDGYHYGGTRYMPLQFLLYAGAERLGGDYILSAKIVSLVAFALLLGLVYWILRGLGCSRSAGVALTAVIPASLVGFYAATATEGDILPVLIQLAAVALVARTTRRRAVAAAAVLCSIAFFAKLSADWAPIAIAIWLLLREPRRGLMFVLVYGGLTVGGVAGLEAFTGGRFLDNIHGLAFSGFLGPHAILIDSPKKLADLMFRYAQATPLIALLALASIVVLRRERRLSIYAVSLVTSLVVLLVVLADWGTDYNHLLDLIVLLSICAGEFLAWARAHERTRPLLAAGAMALVLVALAVAVAAKPGDLRHDTRLAAAQIGGGANDEQRTYDKGIIAHYVAAHDSLLSEDPLVPLLLHRTPAVLDAFTLLRIDQKYPSWRAALVGRIDRGQFDKIVLMSWASHHFGTPIKSAIARSYRLVRAAPGDWWYSYCIYVPRQRASALTPTGTSPCKSVH